MLMHQSRTAPSRVIGLALAIAAASLIADIASAKDDAVSTVVNYRDLDLSQSLDAQRLYGRLKYASKQVCSSYDVRGLQMQQLYDECFHAALNQAVETVNDPKLTALHTAEPRIRVAKRT